jgi:hypothetical protein
MQPSSTRVSEFRDMRPILRAMKRIPKFSQSQKAASETPSHATEADESHPQRFLVLCDDRSKLGVTGLPTPIDTPPLGCIPSPTPPPPLSIGTTKRDTLPTSLPHQPLLQCPTALPYASSANALPLSGSGSSNGGRPRYLCPPSSMSQRNQITREHGNGVVTS